MNFNKKAFTFVELIVSVIILVILAGIGIISYSSYLVGVRDTSRLTNMVSLIEGLGLYKLKANVPIPDNYIEVKANGELIAYQGYIGENILDLLDFSGEGVDPKNNTYYSYYLTKNRKYFQLMGYLESEKNLDLYGFVNKTFAVDYSILYPTVQGNMLGILSGTGNDLNIPIQEILSVKNSGFVDIGNTNIEYVARKTDSENITGTGTKLVALKGLANVGGDLLSIEGKSCKDLNDTYDLYGLDGNYWISIVGEDDFRVYCDMTTDGGGWTLVHKTTDNPNDLTGDLTTNEGTLGWDNNEEYRLSINYWKYLSTEKAMAKNIRVDGLEWDDIDTGVINYIGIDKVDFEGTDDYRIFNLGDLLASQNSCTSGTNYWNTSCCQRCVNYNGASSYGNPDNAPMIRYNFTSTDLSAFEGAGGSSDSSRHRLSKMGIFLK